MATTLDVAPFAEVFATLEPLARPPGHFQPKVDNRGTDTDSRTPVAHGFGTGVNWGRIILHGLAHVIGLGHVESRTSIMNEALTQQTLSSSEWGVGDLIGLRQLGREGGCVTVPTPFQGAHR